MSTPSDAGSAEPVAASPAAETAPPSTADTAPPPAAEAGLGAADWPAGANPKLVVQRGLKVGVEYPIYEGPNFIGRSDEQPVDIDLEDQENPEHVWSSRQHACVTFENGSMTIEDLKSANGTYVNRVRLNPGQKQPLKPEDTVQIGALHMKVTA